MTLSIIVPIYNVEQYLHKCIDSILMQTHTDFELILVDDGSTDDSPTICDAYADKDSRIMVIHKENGGLSDARNAGLDVAQGAYIGFVDSDDFIHPQMYEILIDTSERTHADIVQCAFCRFYEGEQLSLAEAEKETEAICIETTDFLIDYYPDNCHRFNSTVCNKLYRKTVFSDIRFPLGKYYEDAYIHLSTLEKSQRITMIPTPLYFYLQRPGSIMHSEYTPSWFQGTHNNNNNLAFFRRKGLLDQAEYALDDYVTRYCKDKFAVCFRRPEYAAEFRTIERNFHREFCAIMKSSRICKMKKLLVLMLLFSPRLALGIASKYFPECIYEFMR